MNQASGKRAFRPGHRAAGAPRARSRLVLMLAAGLASGTVFSTCQTRIRDAVVVGAKDVLFGTLLDPTVIVGFFIDTSASDATSDLSP